MAAINTLKELNRLDAERMKKLLQDGLDLIDYTEELRALAAGEPWPKVVCDDFPGTASCISEGAKKIAEAERLYSIIQARTAAIRLAEHAPDVQSLAQFLLGAERLSPPVNPGVN
jgi:hypothetical protein